MSQVCRTIVIGDVHGCATEVVDLFKKLNVSKDDRVIFVGDLVDRGPDPATCVDIARGWECVMGNHEEKHLRQLNKPLDQLFSTHAYTRTQLRPEHWDYIKTLPLYIRLPEYNAVVVHAGVLPHIPIEGQPDHILLHAQSICPPSKDTKWPTKVPDDTWKFWTHFWEGPERVIFGHSHLSAPLVSEWAVGIDTGCVHGRFLTAVVLPGWEIVQVPARQNYTPKGQGSSSSTRKEIKRVPASHGVDVFS